MTKSLIAYAENEYSNVYMYEIYFNDITMMDKTFFMVSKRVEDCDVLCYDNIYNTFDDATTALKTELKPDTFPTVNLSEEFYDLLEGWDDEPYTKSATAGDYSPSCPWNAPGMSIHDFI